MYARGYRVLSRYVLLLIAAPAIFWVIHWSVGYVSGPTLYEGDRLETRRCRNCRGSGKDAQILEEYPEMGDRCPFCAGTGTVEVVVPGPNRPSRIWGAVIDLEASGGAYAYSNPHNIRRIPLQTMLGPAGMHAIEGALQGAVVVFESTAGDRIEMRADPTGRFSTPLVPGTYSVTVAREGYATLEGEITVLRLTAPIWLERAKLISEEPPEDARSTNGLSFLAALSRPGAGGAFLRLEIASR